MRPNRSVSIAGGLVMGAVAQAVLAQSAPPPGEGTLPAVTITANKREERLQEVPATATVVSPQQLQQQNILTIGDLARAIPAFDASPAGLSMRGFGGISFSLTAESSVGILVDGVSLAGAADFPPDLFDVERIEVLEGPQGTLFGKNASAGIIHIVTKAPVIGRFEGLGRLDAQNRGGKSAQAVLNVPAGDALAIRLAARVRDDPHGTRNLFDGEWDSPHHTDARVRVLWKAAKDLTVNFTADHSETELRGGGRWAVYRSTPGSLLTNASRACGVTIAPENTDVCANPGQNGNKTRVGGYSAQLDWQAGDWRLSSVTAVRDVKNVIANADYDMVSLPAPAFVQPEVKTYHNVSQEVRIASPDYAWGSFVAGAFWFQGRIDQDITGLLTLPAARLGQRNRVSGENVSAAVFGQGTYRLGDALSANLGLRIGHERAETARTGAVAAGSAGPFLPQRLIPVTGQTKDDYVSWRAGAQYDFDAGRMGYVTYAHGYKGPAVNHNATNPRVPAVVRAEVPTMLEAGLKNQFLDGRFALNLSAYAMKVKDYQANVWDPVSLAFVFSNAPELTSRGAIASFYGKPVKSLTVNGGVAYVRSRLGPGFMVECAMGSPPGCVRDATGDPAGGAPKVRAVLAFEHAFPVGTMRASWGGDVVYTSEKVFDRTDPARNLPATTIVGARIAVRSTDGKVGLALYARNLFDRFSPSYRIGNLAAFATGDTRSYTQFVAPESRRVLGVSVDATF